MDLLAAVMLVAAFGVSLASFILLCFLWVRQNKLAEEHTYLAIRNADLVRELTFLHEEVHTTGRVEAIAPEGARQRSLKTQKLREGEEGGHHGSSR